MSGAPNGTVLGNMAACAIVALSITVLALVNAKQLARIIDDLFSIFHAYSLAKMQHSLVTDSQRKPLEDQGSTQKDRGSTKEEVDKDNQQVESSKDLQHRPPRIETWTLLFWVYYITIELPARRVLLASHVLQSRKSTFPALIHVLIGILFLPLLIISCLFQLIICNIADLVGVILGKLFPHILMHSVLLIIYRIHSQIPSRPICRRIRTL
jgi:hypothetical protein